MDKVLIDLVFHLGSGFNGNTHEFNKAILDVLVKFVQFRDLCEGHVLQHK
jgi:hypothetical protein